jgi:rod shape-determining protein MreC
MAILTNRIKSTNSLFEFPKFIMYLLKRFLSVIFIISLLNLLYFSKSQKVNKISLEIVGSCISSGLVLYEELFKYINFFTTKLIYLRDLELENIELKIEIAKLKESQNRYNVIKNENEALKKLLQFVEQGEHNYVTAKLLSVSLNSFGNIAMIGAGTNHGIAIDQIVVNNEGLIGRIIETSGNYSKIMLIGDFNSRIPVVTSLSRERGVLAGGNGKLRMIYLQENHSIATGERILTSGDGKIYPEGIVVAEVTSVSKDRITLEPMAKLHNSDFVNIYIACK